MATRREPAFQGTKTVLHNFKPQSGRIVSDCGPSLAAAGGYGLPLGNRALSDGHVKIEVDTGNGGVTVEPVS